jgi:hypothetical protein
MPEREQEIQIEVLLKEYASASEEIRLYLGEQEKVLALGITVLGAGSVYAFKEQLYLVLLFVPIGLFGVLFYAVLNSTILMSLAGYRQYIGGKVNEMSKNNLLIWEQISDELLSRNVVLIASLHVIYFFFLFSTIVISLWITLFHFGVVLFVVSFIVYSGLLFALILGALKFFVARADAYHLAKTVEGKPVGDSTPTTSFSLVRRLLKVYRAASEKILSILRRRQ